MGNLLVKREKKHIKLICVKCNNKVYIDYKKHMLSNLYCQYCKNKEEQVYDFGEVRYVRIEYK